MCNQCYNNIIRINGIADAVSGAAGNLTLSTSNTVAPEIGNHYITRICVCLKDSDLTGEEPVRIEIDDVIYDVTTCNGEFLQVGRLRRRQYLKLAFEFDTSTAGGHFRVCNDLCPLCLRVITETTAG